MNLFTRRHFPSAPMVIALAAIVLFPAGCSEEGAPPPQMPPAPVTVATPLVRESVEWERFTGRLQPVEQVNVQARVSGHLQTGHFSEGQIVNKGDLLVTIDQRPFDVALGKANASLEQAKAGLRLAESRLAQAKAERDMAVAAETLARTRLENARKAAETEAIAQEQVDVRESEYARTVAGKASAESAILGAEAEIATANASILTARAAIDGAELDLKYTEIKAPITGRISRLLVTKGNLIQGGGANATLLTTIVSTDPIYVFIETSEQELLRYLRESTLEERLSSRYRHPFFLKLIDEEGYPHVGQIDFAGNMVDQDTGTLLVRGILKNPDLTLIPGMFATVQIPSATNRESTLLLIPDEAIVADQSARLVMLVGENNIVQPRPVLPGPMVDGLRVIRSGLAPEDRVIISGLQRAIPGMPVTPMEGTFEGSVVEDGLPDKAEPIPKEDWIRLPTEPLPGDKK